jgi:hypothetical protein
LPDCKSHVVRDEGQPSSERVQLVLHPLRIEKQRINCRLVASFMQVHRQMLEEVTALVRHLDVWNFEVAVGGDKLAMQSFDGFRSSASEEVLTHYIVQLHPPAI